MTTHIREQVTADEIIDAWIRDASKRREACLDVAASLGYVDALASDYDSALDGHSDDRAIRAERLLAAVESKVRHSMQSDAEEQAKRENYVADDYGTDELEAAA